MSAADDIFTEHMIRAAAARLGYMGHKLRTFQIMRGAWTATVDDYEPGMSGVYGLCCTGDTEAEALDELMNAMDEQAEEEEDDEDVDVESAELYGIRESGPI